MSADSEPPGRDEIAAAIAAREHAREPARGVRIADVSACLLLIAVQVGGALLAFTSFMVIPMSIDNCAYQTCGDEKWISYATWIALASMTPAGLFSGIGLIQLGRNRIGFWLPLIGVFAQGATLWAAWRIAALAGPISG
jgi:hypothetical protein